jgi:hypothetical protein
MKKDFFEIAQLRPLLATLPADRAPHWGMMTPQHMVEHLAFAVALSNGKVPMPLAIPEEKAERAQARLLDPAWRMPRAFKAAFMPADSLLPLAYSSLEEATEALFEQIADFHAFFDQNPHATPTHPYFGALDRATWALLHHKHFAHHLEQFGALQADWGIAV